MYPIVGLSPSPPRLQNVARLANGGVKFDFTNAPGASFTVLASTNVGLPSANWTVLGPPAETPSGQYQFTDLQATNIPQRFYRIRSP